MDKKDIYEHLAKIYLDASTKREKRIKKPGLFGNLVLPVGITFILVAAIFVAFKLNQNKTPNLKSEFALILQPDTVKINFHFDPAKKEAYSIDLNQLGLARYKVLAFSARKTARQDNINLRIEFTSAFKEKSEAYIKGALTHKWQDYKIDLAEFKNIADWSQATKLSFVIEEWNVQEKKGVVYIDNVRFLR